MANVRIKGLDRTLEVEPGTDLRTACIQGNVNLFFGPWAKALNCRGRGFCNLCKVEVLEGEDHLAPRTTREAKRLRHKPDSWRLACCATVQGDLLIDTFPVRHAEDEVPAEALQRARLPEDERIALEKEDWAAFRAEKPDKKDAPAGPKKGLLAKVRRKKGIDDEDTHTEGAALQEAEGAPGADGEPKKGLLGRFKKKGDGGDDAADEPAKATKAKRKDKAKKAKKAKPGRKGPAETDDDAAAAGAQGDATDDATDGTAFFPSPVGMLPTTGKASSRRASCHDSSTRIMDSSPRPTTI